MMGEDRYGFWLSRKRGDTYALNRENFFSLKVVMTNVAPKRMLNTKNIKCSLFVQ